MSVDLLLGVAVWLQEVAPRALLLGMTIAYLLCFAGLVVAYLSYRRRRGSGKKTDEGKQP